MRELNCVMDAISQVLNKVLLLPSLTSKGKGVKLNASLAHSERISALAEVEKGMRKKKRS